MKTLTEYIEHADLCELAYQGNIGIMELIKFNQMATPQQKNELKKMIGSKLTSDAWKLIQDVTGVKLVGKEFK